jgi:predicted phosphoribosyltransferase
MFVVMTTKLFSNRLDAAERLIPILRENIDDDSIIVAIPRGAVPMGFHIAKALNLPFDIILVKKISLPENPELAVGSVSINGRVIDPEFAVRRAYIDTETKRLQQLLKEQESLFRYEHPAIDLCDKTVIVIDDGMATGNSMISAIQAVRQQHPSKVIVAIPVSAADALEKVRRLADDVVCPHVPSNFYSVADFYGDFTQVSDQQVKVILGNSKYLERKRI